jgi:hypothetical protein
MQKEVKRNLFLHATDDIDPEIYIHLKLGENHIVEDIKRKLGKRLKMDTYRNIELYNSDLKLENDTSVAELIIKDNEITHLRYEIKSSENVFIEPTPIIRTTRKTSSASKHSRKSKFVEVEAGEAIDELDDSPVNVHKRTSSEVEQSENFMGKKQKHRDAFDADKVFKKRKYSDDNYPRKLHRPDLEEGEIQDYYDSSPSMINRTVNKTIPDFDINNIDFAVTKREEFGSFNLEDSENNFNELDKLFEKIRLHEERKVKVKKSLGERIQKIKNSKQVENKKGYLNFFLDTVNLTSIRQKRQCDFKLNLILDIDSTILHSETLDINSDFETNKQDEIFVITPREGCKLRFKVRKTVLEFLRSISELCNIYISTHAQEFYALDVVRILNEETGIGINEDQVHSVKNPLIVLPQKTLRLYISLI